MRGTFPTVLALIAALTLSGRSASADGKAVPTASGDPLPEELEGVDVTEKLGAKIPRDLSFTTDRGQRVKLGDLIGPDRPVLLTFNYSNCPLLCSVQLGGVTEAMAGMQRPLGENFHVVTVVLDPKETPETARETKQEYLQRLGQARKAKGLPPVDPETADASWTFLVGQDRDIKSLADSVGFGYVYHPGRKEYLHPAVFMMITPSGRVAQYISGVHFEPEMVDGAIASAAMDVTTKSTQDFILSCYHYEAPEGFNAFSVMKIAGIIFGVGMVLVLAGIHLRSRLSGRPAA